MIKFQLNSFSCNTSTLMFENFHSFLWYAGNANWILLVLQTVAEVQWLKRRKTSAARRGSKLRDGPRSSHAAEAPGEHPGHLLFWIAVRSGGGMCLGGVGGQTESRGYPWLYRRRFVGNNSSFKSVRQDLGNVHYTADLRIQNFRKWSNLRSTDCRKESHNS